MREPEPAEHLAFLPDFGSFLSVRLVRALGHGDLAVEEEGAQELGWTQIRIRGLRACGRIVRITYDRWRIWMNALTRIIIIRFLCAFLEVIRQVDADIVVLPLTLRTSGVEGPDGADGGLNTPSYVTNEDSNGSC